MDRRSYANAWGDIVQQGPEQSESPASDVSGNQYSSYAARGLAPRSSTGSSASSSPSLLKKRTMGGEWSAGSDTDASVRYQAESIVGHAARREDQAQQSDSASVSRQSMGHPPYCQSTCLCQHPAMYAPAYYYPPHPYLVASNHPAPPQGSWILLPPHAALFTPPSPSRREFSPAQVDVQSQQRSQGNSKFRRDTEAAEWSETESTTCTPSRAAAMREGEHGRTPLFGEQPAWWAPEQEQLEDTSGMATLSTGMSACPERHDELPMAAASDTEADRRRREPTQAGEVESRSLCLPVDQQPEEKRHTKEATAFTIEFTDQGSSTRMTDLDKTQAAEKTWKTQSANRAHSNFVRRSMRKEGAPSSLMQQPEKTANPTPPPTAKAYLLERMLEASPTPTRKADQSPPQSPTMCTLQVGSNTRESDACSDAGTYVVDKDEDQVLGADEGSAGGGDVSSDSDQDTTSQSTLAPATPVGNSSGNSRAEEDKKRKELLTQLCKLSSTRSAQSSAPLSKPSIGRQSGRALVATSRLDAARHSTRSASASRPSNAPAVASKAPKPQAAKADQMKRNWLRRKEYNPMKAAADAKRSSKPMEQEEPGYLANRSRSFHMGSSRLTKTVSAQDADGQPKEEISSELAMLSDELNQRTRGLLSKLDKDQWRHSDKQAALSSLLQQLRLANKTLQDMESG